LFNVLNGGLFSNVYWCDWTALTPSTALSAKLDRILSSIIAAAGGPFALFVPVGSSILAHPLWPKVEKAAGLVIEEHLVTGKTLLPALRLFQATTDLAENVDWLAQPAFAESFETFNGRKKQTLLELRHAFDERVATCTDPQGHAFLPDVYRELQPEEVRSSAGSSLRALRALLTSRQGWDLNDLVQTLDERPNLRGWTVRAVVVELHRVTGKILDQPGHTGASGTTNEDAGVAALALWTALLLSWDERLRTIVEIDATGYRRRPNALIGSLDRLARDFIERVELWTTADALAGTWAELDVALIRMATDPADVLGPTRAATILALDGFLRRSKARVSWLSRLEHRVRRAVAEAKAAEAERHKIRIAEERRTQDEQARRKRIAAERAIADNTTGR
jgi:hypothetical protein